MAESEELLREMIAQWQARRFCVGNLMFNWWLRVRSYCVRWLHNGKPVWRLKLWRWIP